MKNLWDDRDASTWAGDPLQMRVYTSRLLGKETSLVLHGGGNTSVKTTAVNIFGEQEDVLYVKGSGWDLATIETAGFAAVRMNVLTFMATLESLADTDMVRHQRAAMMDPSAPNPSVEAILHAIIPLKYVDHSHADAVITITNSGDGEARIREIYGDRVLIVPYVMPGFLLARKVFQLTEQIDWNQYEGMVLMNHGLFTFGDDARSSYERTIKLVTEAEDYLESHGAFTGVASRQPASPTALLELATLRKSVSQARGKAVLACLSTSSEACGFSSLPNAADISSRGPLTPDHVIRNKRIPLVVQPGNAGETVKAYTEDYHRYFKEHTDDKLSCLQPAPAWAVWPGQGTVAFGRTMKEAGITADIVQHTLKAMQWAETLDEWKALPASDIFDVEYWELEQAKLGKATGDLPLQGKVALVTGAASGIGRACVEALLAQGACVAALDISPTIVDMFKSSSALGIICDVTDSAALQTAVDTVIKTFGGMDILVPNAGIFPASRSIEDMDPEGWDKCMLINLSSQQRLIQIATPFLKEGIDPAIVVMGSKNVPAPGPGAAAYSVAKAGLTQLARVAAMELAAHGIRVNIVHPNAVFDTAIWTPEVLQGRADHYHLTVDEYKRNNLLHTEITSADVAELVCTMAGTAFAKTTGAQVPIDGGNERVI